MKRSLKPEELQYLESKGYDTSGYDGKEYDFPSDSTAAGAAGRSALASAGPTLAGGAGFGLTMLALAPETMGASLLAIPVAAGAGYLASKTAQDVQEPLLTDKFKSQLVEDAAEHPWATTAGGIATMPLGGFNLSPGNLAKAGGAITRLATRLPTTAAERAALVNVGSGAALGGIQEAVMAPLEGREITAKDIALGTALGAGFSKPNAIGKRFGFHEAPAKVTDNPAALSKAASARLKRKPVIEVPEGYVPESVALAPVKTEKPVTNDIIDLINSKVTEANKPKPPAPASALKGEVSAALKAKGITGELTPRYADAVTNEILAERGIQVEADGTLDVNGKALFDEGTRKVLFNQNSAGLDTLPHEGVHHMRWDLEALAAKGDKAAAEKLARWDALNEPERVKINAERKAKGLAEQDAHEFAVSEQGFEFVKQQLNLKKETNWKKWWNDTKALFNAKYNTGKVSLEDLRRAINFKFVHERVKATATPGFTERSQENEEKPLNPGGSLESLPPDLQAKSNAVKDSMAAEFEKLKAEVERLKRDRNQGEDEGLRIKSAATKAPDGTITTGSNHYKASYRRDNSEFHGMYIRDNVPGFVTNTGKFVTRKEALSIARKAGQMWDTAADKSLTGEITELDTAHLKDNFYREQPPGEGLAKGRTPEQHRAQQAERDRKAKEELASIRGNTLDRRHADTAPRTPIPAPTTEQAKHLLEEVIPRNVNAVMKRIKAGSKKDASVPFNQAYGKAFDDIVKDVYTDYVKQGDDVDGRHVTLNRIANRHINEFLAAGKLTGKSLNAERGEGGAVSDAVTGKLIVQEPVKAPEVRKAAAGTREIEEAIAELQEQRQYTAEEFGSESDEVENIDKAIERLRKSMGREQGEGESLSEADRQRRTLNPEWREDQIEEQASLYGQRSLADIPKVSAKEKFDKMRAVVERAQEDNESLFDLKANKVLRASNTNASGAFNGDQILGVLRNQLSPVEYDMLKKAGIEEVAGNRYINKQELLGWIKEHGPKVEVHSYGMEGKVSVERRDYDQLTHWIDGESADIKADARQMLTGRLVPNEQYWDTLAQQKGQATVDNLKRYVETHNILKTQKELPTDPRATSAYDTVSAFPTHEPMPEWTVSKEGKNVQRVDVVIPQKNIGNQLSYEDWTKNKRQMGSDEREINQTNYQQDKGYKSKKEPLWQPDNLHENLPNTLGWSMIQYKTGAKGEKIAFITEAQSRWGQKMREYKADKKNEILARHVVKESDHPLLRDYNRLILKAAIEQARKEGATHIVVSDSKTALMSEVLDTQYMGIGKNWTREQAEKYLTPSLEKDGFKPYQHGDSWYLSKHEGGFDFNYDTSMPKIAEELTGAKGERVELGEHKNAIQQGHRITDSFESKEEALLDARHSGYADNEITIKQYAPNNWGYESNVGQRKNLIFRNADGTPKTSVSGRMFPLEKISKRLAEGDKFTLFNKHQEQGEGLFQGKHGFLEAMSPTFDKVKGVDPEVGPVLGNAFNRFEVTKRTYKGWRDEALKKLGKYDLEEVNRVGELRREAFRNGEDLPEMADEAGEINDIFERYYYGDIGKERNDLGLMIDSREAGTNKSYTPDMLNEETIDLFVNRPTSIEARYAKNQWVDYLVEKSKGAITEAEARSNINDYVKAIGGSHDNYLSVNFGAIRKASGYGLPDSLRETDHVKALARYGRRAAADLAMFKELESKPEIGGALELKNPNTGQPIEHPNSELGLSADKRIRNAMKWVTDDFGNTMSKSQPHINAFVRLVHNALLGGPTGIRDLVSVPVNSLPYIQSFGDLAAAIKGVTSFRQHADAALRSGAKQPNLDLTVFNQLMEGPDRAVKLMHKVGTGLRKWQGREALENISREVTFGMGKELTLKHLASDSAASDKFLEKFGTGVDGDIRTLEGAALEKAVDTVAANFTERVQGTYGGRGLPVGVVESQFAPFMSLQKWGIEKANVIFQDVFKPALTGENYLPLLTYSLGSVLTGAAIQELNKALTGRKPQDPDIKEALAKGDAKAYATELATLMQLGSFAGIVGDTMKALTDTAIRGKTTKNVVSFPAYTAVTDTGERVADATEAIRQGENPWDVIKMLSLDLMTQNIQNARALANHTIKDKELERSDKFRDRRTYNELEGKPAGEIPRPNRYLGIDERKFKQATTPAEVGELMPRVLQRAKAKADGNPEKFRQAIASLKGNSYQTMPSPEDSPLEFRAYYQYLVRTQGQKEADSRLRDFLTQRLLNRQKSSLLPSLR